MPVQPPPSIGASAAPSATMGAPKFDPYATGSGAAATPPTLGSQPPAWSGGSPAPVAPAPYAAPYTAPYTSPGTTIAPPPTAAGGVPSYPGAAPYQGFNQQPPVLLPGSQGFTAPTINWPQPEQGRHMRFFQEFRVDYTWVNGKDATNQMQTDDIDFATTMNFPNFFWSGRPLHVSPIFDLSLWSGPQYSIEGEGLPPRAYAALVDFKWEPMLTPQFGANLDFSLGIYSDFSAVTTDAIRYPSAALAVLNLSPTFTLKAGAEYFDRVQVGWLPAGGVLWQPNPRVYWDIYFPRPKLSQYLTTVGNTDLWWYLWGEYGGGSWYVAFDEPVPGGVVPYKTRMDIDDYRIGIGFEWRHQCNLRGHCELAYVFNRKLVFASDGSSDGPQNQSLADSVMLRAGFAY